MPDGGARGVRGVEEVEKYQIQNQINKFECLRFILLLSPLTRHSPNKRQVETIQVKL